MREGRKLTDNKQYAQAIAAFEAALVANPDDPSSVMEGPFASLDAFCKTQPKAEDETPCECKTEELKGAKLAAPFAGVALADVVCRETDHSDNDHGWRFAVARTAAGWFARRLGDYSDTLWCQDHGALESAKTDQLIPGDAVELAITFKEDGSCIGHAQTATEFDTTSLIIGSARPRSRQRRPRSSWSRTSRTAPTPRTTRAWRVRSSW